MSYSGLDLFCIISDDYPLLSFSSAVARMTPSFRFNIVALVQLTKVLNFQRVGIICGFREISLFAYQFLMSLIQMDLQAGEVEFREVSVVRVSSRSPS